MRLIRAWIYPEVCLQDIWSLRQPQRTLDHSLGGEPMQGNIDSVRRNLDHSLSVMNDSVFDPGGQRPIGSSTAHREEKGRFEQKRHAE